MFESTDIIAVKDMPAPVQPIFPAVSVAVPNACVFSNADTFGQAFAAHLRRDVYEARVARCDPVSLVELPAGTLVDGRGFQTLAGGRWLRDQCHPALLGEPARVEALRCGGALALWSGLPVCNVRTPCLLVARYGETTWGHWLAELLPRAIAAEKAAPRHFTFAMPAFLVSDTYDEALRRAALDSLSFHGIGPDRLLPLSPLCIYRFACLTAVTPSWSEPLMMHPDVVDLMRNSNVDRAGGPDRIFLRRQPNTGRTVLNEDALLAIAVQRGFTPILLSKLAFTDQVRCFASASKVVLVLGSDLAGLLYAPDGVGVVSLAPGDWGDRFFYALIQLRDGSYADLRGTPAACGPLHRMSFSVDVEAFEEALNRIARTFGRARVRPAPMSFNARCPSDREQWHLAPVDGSSA